MIKYFIWDGWSAVQIASRAGKKVIEVVTLADGGKLVLCRLA